MKTRRRRMIDEDRPDRFHETIEAVTEDGQTLIITRKMPEAKDDKGIPVVLVHGLGQNRYSWQTADMSFVDYLVSRGMDVYVAELRGHGLSRLAGSEHPASFSEYVKLDMPAILAAVHKRAGSPPFFCGHSLGGTIGYALDPEQQEHLRGFVFISSPSNFGKGLFMLRAMSMFLVIAHKVSALRAVDLMDEHTAFRVDLLGKALGLGLDFFDSRACPPFYRLWSPGSMDRDTLEERVTKGFDQTSLEMIKMMIRWAAKGRFIDEQGRDSYERNLKAKTLPALFVVGDNDAVVPAASVRPGFEMISSRDKTWKVFNAKDNRVHWGHLDLVLGREAPVEVWSYIAQWMEKR